MKDILESLNIDVENQELPTKKEISSAMDENRVELLKYEKKLKKAKKKGKKGKKYLKKIKKLKQENKKLKELYQAAKQQPFKGRWDVTIEKSLPEALKLINNFVKRSWPLTTKKRKKMEIVSGEREVKLLSAPKRD